MSRIGNALVLSVMVLTPVVPSLAEHPLIELPELAVQESMQESWSFASTVLTRDPQPFRIATQFVDVLPGHSAVLTMDESQEPVFHCKIDEMLFWQDGDSLGRTPGRYYSKIVDDGLVQAILHRTSSPGGPKEDDFSLPIARLFASEPVLATFADDKTYMFSVRRQSSDLQIFKRPPSERRLLGHPLRAVLIKPRDSRAPQQVFFNMQTGDRPIGRVDHDQFALAADELSSIASLPSTEDQQEVMRRICSSAFARSQPWSPAARFQVYELLKDSVERKDRGGDAEEVSQARVHAIGIMMSLRREIDLLLQNGSGVVLDPFVRGFVLEQAVWDRESVKIPFSAQILSLVEALNVPQGITGSDSEMRFSLMCAFADLGFAPNAWSYAVLNNCLQGGYEDHVAAAILARWGRPTEPHHVRAVIDFIGETTIVGERLDAIETAIIMGHFKDLDEAHREEWFRSRVSEADEDRRRRSLAYAAKHVDGRSYLLAKQKQLREEPEVRVAIRDLLLFEVSATEEFGQYDFISEEECRKIREELAR